MGRGVKGVYALCNLCMHLFLSLCVNVCNYHAAGGGGGCPPPPLRLEQIIFALGGKRSTWDPKCYLFDFSPLVSTSATLHPNYVHYIRRRVYSVIV